MRRRQRGSDLSIRHFITRPAGQSLVEFAVFLPVLLLLIIGVAETGNALNAYIGVTGAAREGARLAARGNIFPSPQVKQVIESQTHGLDLAAHGSIVMTVVKTDSAGVGTYQVTQLLGTTTSRFSQASLYALYQIALPPTSEYYMYLRKESFVMIEVFYDCPTLTLFFWPTIPIYSYTVMQISAVS